MLVQLRWPGWLGLVLWGCPPKELHTTLEADIKQNQDKHAIPTGKRVHHGNSFWLHKSWCLHQAQWWDQHSQVHRGVCRSSADAKTSEKSWLNMLGNGQSGFSSEQACKQSTAETKKLKKVNALMEGLMKNLQLFRTQALVAKSNKRVDSNRNSSNSRIWNCGLSPQWSLSKESLLPLMPWTPCRMKSMHTRRHRIGFGAWTREPLRALVALTPKFRWRRSVAADPSQRAEFSRLVVDVATGNHPHHTHPLQSNMELPIVQSGDSQLYFPMLPSPNTFLNSRLAG